MGKRWRLIGAALVLIMAGSLAFYTLRPKEPAYQGKTLTEWLQAAMIPKSPVIVGRPIDTDYDKTREAVISMGSNAIPTLLKLYQARDSVLGGRITYLIKQQRWIHINALNAFEQLRLGRLGFHILASAKLLAVENLAPLINSPDRNDREDALDFLSSIRPSKDVYLPILFGFLKDADEKNRFKAVETLYRFFPAEAEKAEVNKLFPEFRPSTVPSVSTEIFQF